MTISELVNRITHHRSSQEATVAYVATRDQPLAFKLNDCGSYLRVREWIDSGETRLLNANFCKKHLLCRCCAWRRANRFLGAYAAKLQAVLAEHPQLIPAHIVLTTVNGPDLVERLQFAKDAWKKMGKARLNGKNSDTRNKLIEWNHVAGSIRSLEITFNEKTQEWHVHFHILALLTSFIDLIRLSEQWQHFCGDGSKIVYAKKCHGEPMAGLCEVLKYAVKFSEVPNPQLLDAHYACQGSRLADPQGLLRGVKEPDIDQDDPEEIAALTGPFRDWLFRWMFGQGKFRMEEADPLPQPPPDSPRWNLAPVVA